nr:PepSY domain-containing protein [uncultured Methanoregula sp.]
MKKRVNLIIGIVVILAIGGCIAYAAAFGTFAAKKTVDPTESVRQFIGDPDAVVVFEKSNKNVLGEPYDTYRVNGERFTVDSDTGSVIGASFFSVPMTKSTNLSLDRAEIVARKFAERHYINFNSRIMEPTESKVLDHGDAGIEYAFTWSEQDNNINTGNTVHVSVNTEGTVLSYYARDKTAPKIEQTARIGKDQAIETATRYVIERSKIGNITSTETSAHLMVMPDDHNRVVWTVDLQLQFMDSGIGILDHRGGEIYVDAMTGDVVKYNPCM